MERFPSSIMADLLDNNGRAASWIRVYKLKMNSPLAEISPDMLGSRILIQPSHRIRLPSKITKASQVSSPPCRHMAHRLARRVTCGNLLGNLLTLPITP